MTDYHPLIARAVEGLDRSTGEARRALYERARNALVAQLRSNQPALSEADITKERLALEEAIRRVEAEAARKSRNESRAEQRAEPRAAAAPAAAPEGAAQVRRASGAPRRDRSSPPPADLPRAGWTAVLPSARERLLSGRSSLKKQGVKGFRDVVGEVHDLGAATAKAAQTARQTREAFEPEAPQYPPRRTFRTLASVRAGVRPRGVELGRLRYAAARPRTGLRAGRRAPGPRTTGPLLTAQRGSGAGGRGI